MTSLFESNSWPLRKLVYYARAYHSSWVTSLWFKTPKLCNISLETRYVTTRKMHFLPVLYLAHWLAQYMFLYAHQVYYVMAARLSIQPRTSFLCGISKYPTVIKLKLRTDTCLGPGQMPTDFGMPVTNFGCTECKKVKSHFWHRNSKTMRAINLILGRKTHLTSSKIV